MCDITLRYKQRLTNAAVCVVRHVSRPLLERDVIAELNLLAKVDEVTDTGQCIKSRHPELLRAFGCMQGKYTICLKSDTQLFAVTVPRKVAYPLMQPLNEELDRLLSLGIIVAVIEPTPWCAPIVVGPKKVGICLCVD